MNKFMREYGKQILAVASVFLMVAFALPSGMKQMGLGGNNAVVAYIGNEKIRGQERYAAKHHDHPEQPKLKKADRVRPEHDPIVTTGVLRGQYTRLMQSAHRGRQLRAKALHEMRITAVRVGHELDTRCGWLRRQVSHVNRDRLR